jgi:uncharacterized membrane protein YhhN
MSHATRPPFRGLALAIAAAALAAITGTLLAGDDPVGAWQWLHWICKPLATALIFLLAWRAVPALSLRYRRWVLAGIGCSLLGDILLMLPQDLFVGGLLAFLFGHLCFLVALLGDSRFSLRPPPLPACLAYGAINLYLLWGAIAAPLRLPVIVYVLMLASMAGQALARVKQFTRRGDAQTHSARLAAAGALLFMLSDTLLAWNRFRGPMPLAALWVLTTYYLSLWWIARSVAREGGIVEAGASQ